MYFSRGIKPGGSGVCLRSWAWGWNTHTYTYNQKVRNRWRNYVNKLSSSTCDWIVTNFKLDLKVKKTILSLHPWVWAGTDTSGGSASDTSCDSEKLFCHRYRAWRRRSSALHYPSATAAKHMTVNHAHLHLVCSVFAPAVLPHSSPLHCLSLDLIY